MGLVDAIRGLTRSPAFKFIIIIILILALAIPLLFVYLMVKERAQYAASAKAEIGRAWGGEQSVRGPFIIVPTVRLRLDARGNPRSSAPWCSRRVHRHHRAGQSLPVNS